MFPSVLAIAWFEPSNLESEVYFSAYFDIDAWPIGHQILHCPANQ